MKCIIFTEEGHLLSADLKTEEVLKLAAENKAVAEDRFIISVSNSGIGMFLNSTAVPFISAVEFLADVLSKGRDVYVRMLSPSFVSENKKMSPKARAYAPKYARMISKLKDIKYVSVDLIVPETEITQPAIDGEGAVNGED